MFSPDFQAKDTSVDEVVQALHTNGCCALRGIIPVKWLDDIRKRVEIEYAVMDDLYSNGNMTENDYRHCYRYGIVRPFEQEYELENGVLMSDVMINCIAKTMIKDVYCQFFKEKYLNMLIPSSHVRRVRPEGAVPFHQDSSVMRLNHTEIMNSWFPLDVAGVKAPSIEAYPRAQSSCWPCGENRDGSLYSHLQISEEQITQRLADIELWSPVLYPGDVFLLHSYTVHRTNLREDMTESRRDFELRFARRSDLESRTDINQRPIDFV
jgi:hypothetical protein